MAELKVIRGEEKKPIDKSCVELLTELVDDAKKGDVTAVIAMVLHDEEVFTFWSEYSEGYDPDFLYALEQLRLELLGLR